MISSSKHQQKKRQKLFHCSNKISLKTTKKTQVNVPFKHEHKKATAKNFRYFPFTEHSLTTRPIPWLNTVRRKPRRLSQIPLNVQSLGYAEDAETKETYLSYLIKSLDNGALPARRGQPGMGWMK